MMAKYWLQIQWSKYTQAVNNFFRDWPKHFLLLLFLFNIFRVPQNITIVSVEKEIFISIYFYKSYNFLIP